MSRSLREELQQRRPFASRAEEAHLNLIRTAATLSEGVERVLKPAGISLPQYNVLRILRGAGNEGLCRNALRDRLLTRMPDVTRLLDRMEEAGLVQRTRETADRRQVRTQLTPQGRRVVDALDAPIAAEHQARLGHLADGDLTTLITLLETVRRPDA